MDPLLLSDEGQRTPIFEGESLDLAINNEGEVITEASAEATTGNNTQIAGGSASMVTGEAMALSSAAALVNTTLVGVDMLVILPQNIWLWEGKILNYFYPGSVSDPQEILGFATNNSSECENECLQRIAVDNTAQVETKATAIASTGDNTQVAAGEATMNTGPAAAGATATAVVNSTLIDSRLRILHLLLFAPWTGNLVFAYPDLVTTVSAPASVKEGEDIIYTITLTNLGDAKARGVRIGHTIVNDEHLVAESEELVNDLLPGESQAKMVSFNTAGRGGHNVKLSAVATGEGLEESLSNNSSEVSTLVVSEEKETTEITSEENKASEEPIIYLTSQNNINGFVYPGDGVTYDMTVRNTGSIAVYGAVLVQNFYSPEGELISEMNGKVGDISVSKQKGVRFVLTTSPELPSGKYYTESYVVAKSDQGVESKSNIVINEIKLVSRSTQILGTTTVQVQEEVETNATEPTILGAATPPACQNCQSFPWYMAITGGTLMYYWISSRRRDFVRVLKWGLVLPLSAYAGLLWSNPDCRQGMVMMNSASEWCRYFLPIAYGLYDSMMMVMRRLVPQQ
jgi:uncharacterized repeat protein (TIGR01451 family)